MLQTLEGMKSQEKNISPKKLFQLFTMRREERWRMYSCPQKNCAHLWRMDFMGHGILRDNHCSSYRLGVGNALLQMFLLSYDLFAAALLQWRLGATVMELRSREIEIINEVKWYSVLCLKVHNVSLNGKLNVSATGVHCRLCYLCVPQQRQIISSTHNPF